MKKNIQTLLFVLLAGLANTALAWGEREQGVLQGMAGLLLFQHLAKPQDVPTVPPPHVYIPPPVYVSPPVYYHRPTCFFIPQHDSWGRVMYYRQVCR